MSRIAPKAITAGKPRRITANWAFERCSSSGPTAYGIPCSAAEMTDAMEPKDSSNDFTNDGTDSGIGSAIILSANHEILTYMADNLMHFMNPTLLLPQLIKYDLITEEDAAYISSPLRSNEERKEQVLRALVEHEGDMERLVECLAEDTVHSSHRYMARRLREALEKKKQYHECTSPIHSSREPSPSQAPIKPRGAAQRNSIAKLLATKRNNVSNLVSQIETKEMSQQQPKKPNQHLQTYQREFNSSKTSTGVQKNGSGTYNDKSTQYSSPSCTHLSTSVVSHHQNTIPSQNHSLSPCHKHPQSPSLDSNSHHMSPQTNPNSNSHSINQPASTHTRPHAPNSSDSHSLSPMSPTYHPHTTIPAISDSHSISITSSTHPEITPDSHSRPNSQQNNSQLHSHILLYTHVHTASHSHHPTNISQSHSSPVGTTHHALSSHSGNGWDDSHNSGSSSGFQANMKRYRPINEAVLRHAYEPSSPTRAPRSTEISRVIPKGRETTSKQTSSAKSDIVSDMQAQRKTFPDLLSSPTSPKSPKLPILPPATTLETTNHSPYTNELPSPAVDHVIENSVKDEEMKSVSYRHRTTRLAGLTTKFHKNRRSASMSSYDTRSFKRGEQLSASVGQKDENSYHNQNKVDSSKVRASVREGTEKLIKRRIDWLQERVQFTDCPEHVQFTSQTHCGEERELLYSGTLNKHGKPRFVVLFTDYLLILKAKRPSVPTKLGGVFSFQSSRIDWFSDLEYTAKKPLPLHLLTVQHQSSKQSNDNFCLHFNDKNKVMEVVLQAVSKEARDIWVEELSEAITLATSAHADSFVLVGNRALTKISGEPYRKLQLQIHSASSLGLAANCNSFSLFSVIELGKQRCRTPAVMGGYNPSWEYKCEFTDFNDEDSLLIEVFSENIFRPNDFLGCVSIMLTSLPKEQSGRKVYDGNMTLAGLEEAFVGELHVTVEQGWETKM